MEKALRPDTAIVSAMMVNNEIGVIQPIDELGKLCRSKGNNASTLTLTQSHTRAQCVWVCVGGWVVMSIYTLSPFCVVNGIGLSYL